MNTAQTSNDSKVELQNIHKSSFMEPIAKLESLIDEIGDLHSKLILLAGPSQCGKTKLLRQLSAKLKIECISLGLDLGCRLAATLNSKRGFLVGELLHELITSTQAEATLLLDNLELLFETGFESTPLNH